MPALIDLTVDHFDNRKLLPSWSQEFDLRKSKALSDDFDIRL